MTRFDWPTLLRIGLHGLRLRPEAFWALTPVELQIMLGQGATAPSLTRQGLDALLKAHPDDTEGRADERE
ncbi:MAG: phage tail assembly chaperone [Rhodobacteraceae bacterium]|nr:phage tail assembly chaperone [Paracoccaceae bacterium]MCW9044544.1 phage tail assembly chaperone [Pseudopelagicola sp.]